MKKKIMIAMLSILLFSFVIITILFVVIENYQYMENMKQTLNINNQLIINVLSNEN